MYLGLKEDEDATCDITNLAIGIQEKLREETSYLHRNEVQFTPHITFMKTSKDERAKRNLSYSDHQTLLSSLSSSVLTFDQQNQLIQSPISSLLVCEMKGGVGGEGYQIALEINLPTIGCDEKNDDEWMMNVSRFYKSSSSSTSSFIQLPSHQLPPSHLINEEEEELGKRVRKRRERHGSIKHKNNMMMKEEKEEKKSSTTRSNNSSSPSSPSLDKLNIRSPHNNKSNETKKRNKKRKDPSSFSTNHHMIHSSSSDLKKQRTEEETKVRNKPDFSLFQRQHNNSQSHDQNNNFRKSQFSLKHDQIRRDQIRDDQRGRRRVVVKVESSQSQSKSKSTSYHHQSKRGRVGRVGGRVDSRRGKVQHRWITKK